MKYFKMLLYKDKKAEPGEPPGNWPAYLNPLKENEEVLPPWTKITEEDYHAYRASLRPQYDEWKVNFNDPKEAKYARLDQQCNLMRKEMKVYDEYEANGLTVPDHIIQMRQNCALLEVEQERLLNLEVGGQI